MKRKSCWKAWSASGDRTNVIRVWIAKIPNFQWNHSPPQTLFSFGKEKTLSCFRCIWISLSRGQNVSQGAMQRRQELATPDRPLCKPKHRNSWKHIRYCGHFWGPYPSGDLMKWLLNDLQRHQTLHFSNSQDRVAFGRKLQYNGWRCTCKMSLRVWKICSPQNTTIKQAWDAFQLLIKCDNIEMHLGNWLISILSYIKPTIHRTRMG